MCTCVTYKTSDHYFGRNLDLEFSYHESVTVTPRNFPLPFRKNKTMKTHNAIIGMAFVCDGFPLYYDATNEYGLSMAGLNFPGNGYFSQPCDDGKDEVAPFEFIPWVLGQCKTLADARKLLERIRLVSIPFSLEVSLYCTLVSCVELVAYFVKSLSGLYCEGVSVVSGVDCFLTLLILGFVLSSFLDSLIDLFIGHVRSSGDSDVLLFSCAQILSRYCYDTVCIDIESNLDLWNTSSCWRDSIETELSE